MKRILFALLFMVIGMAIGVFMEIQLQSKEKKFNVNAVELRTYSVDSLENIMDTTRSVLQEKQPSKYDTLKMIGDLRDKVLDARGRTTNAMIGFIKKPKVYNHLDSLRTDMQALVDSCNDIIMAGSLDQLRPTNKAMRSLILDIKDKTEGLTDLAKTVATIADVVSAITSILALPVLAPVQAAAVTAQ